MCMCIYIYICMCVYVYERRMLQLSQHARRQGKGPGPGVPPRQPGACLGWQRRQRPRSPRQDQLAENSRSYGHGSKAPVNIPTKIGSKMGDAPTPNGTIAFDPQPFTNTLETKRHKNSPGTLRLTPLFGDIPCGTIKRFWPSFGFPFLGLFFVVAPKGTHFRLDAFRRILGVHP